MNPLGASPAAKSRITAAVTFLALTLALTSTSWANAGTPLMWAGAFHLVIGNALIGLAEGLLLSWLFRAPLVGSIPVMIAANYGSAWMGYLLLDSSLLDYLQLDINNVWSWLWRIAMLLYLFTLVVEWPFVAGLLCGRGHWLRRSLFASLLVQSLSYLFLVWYYLSSSGISLHTRATVVSPQAMQLPDGIVVYYIGNVDGAVYRRRLTDPQSERIAELTSSSVDNRLFIRHSSDEPTEQLELVARLGDRLGSNSDEATYSVIVPNLAERGIAESGKEGSWFTFGPVNSLPGAERSTWKFETGFWPIEGLVATNKRTDERIWIAWETPFAAWAVRNAIQLPGDLALFQLGTDQICLFDPKRRQVALLWHGRSPVAVLDEGTDTATFP